MPHQHYTIRFENGASQGIFPEQDKAWDFATRHFPDRSFTIQPIDLMEIGTPPESKGSIFDEVKVNKVWVGETQVYPPEDEDPLARRNRWSI